MNNEPKTCAYALGHLNQQFRNNRVAPCFRCVAKIGDHSTDLMSDMINGEAARHHRMTLMSGNWPAGCISCKDFEEAGIRSTRLSGLSDETFDVQKLLAGYDPLTGSIPLSNMTSIEIRFGNECNLQCRHCDVMHSSKWEATMRKNPDMADRLKMGTATFDQAKPAGYYDDIVENIVPHLHTIMFSGGETLYQKQHYEFIDKIPAVHAKKIYLTYVTNGTLTGLGKYNVFDLWKKFKQINVIVSTDGTRELFEYFRHGAKWEDVAANMRAFKEAGVTLTSEITTSIFQIFDLPRILDDIYEIGPKNISSSLVQLPGELNVRIIPDDLKAMLARQWKDYLSSITDQRKLKMVKPAGDMVMDYMQAENNTGLTWEDFKNYARTLDDALGTNVMRDCPTIAKYLA